MKKTIALCILTALVLTGCAQYRGQPEPISPEPPAAPPAAQTAPSAESGAGITEEEARSLAIDHAGLTADQVTFVKSDLDRDDGRKVYDVEFYTEDFREYDYEINADTGEIVEFDSDAEFSAPAELPTSSEQPAPSENSNTISEDEAKSIAIARVPGASLSDIREFKKDYDDGRLEYEGKISFDRMEYEFEIDGTSGEILNWEEETIFD